jgi:Ni/Co efflux regulator RcnB
MKQLLCAVAAIALMTPSVAPAQSQDNQRNQTEQNQKRADRQQQRQQRQQQRQAKPARTARTTRTVQRTQVRAARPARTTRTVERTQVRAGRPTRVTQVTRVTRPARNAERTRRVTTRQVARSLPTYRIGHRPATFRRIRAQSFRYPRGYHYRRFRRGSILPRLFLSSLYYWANYAALGVGPPPPGYVWVRYGPDLLLVNRYNGRIADVIYGAFY